jgi:heme A synthase
MLRRFIALCALCTLALVGLGGLVHNTRSSLACPDWPLCFGRVFPRMEGGVLIEHSHRLLASTVGLFTIVLLVALWKSGRKGLVRWGWLALGLVVVQGLLGGLTVIFRLPTWISTTHLAMSQLYLCTLGFLYWRLGGGARPALDGKLGRLALGGGALVFVQMLMGALMRHLGAGLACVEIPLCKGTLFPAGGNGYLHLHMLHRIFGLLVFGHLVGVAIAGVKRGSPLQRRLAIAAPVIAAVQVGLGLWSVSSFLGVVPVTLHLVVASLLLVDLFALYLAGRPRARAAGDEATGVVVPLAAELAS